MGVTIGNTLFCTHFILEFIFTFSKVILAPIFTHLNSKFLGL